MHRSARPSPHTCAGYDTFLSACVPHDGPMQLVTAGKMYSQCGATSRRCDEMTRRTGQSPGQKLQGKSSQASVRPKKKNTDTPSSTHRATFLSSPLPPKKPKVHVLLSLFSRPFVTNKPEETGGTALHKVEEDEVFKALGATIERVLASGSGRTRRRRRSKR